MTILPSTCDTRLRRAPALPRPGAAGAVLAILLGSSGALAAPEARDLVAAEALFNEARQLVKAGSWAEGCPKFEKSLALNPSASTMINIARCRAHEGKLATAWGDYRRALAMNSETQGAERQRALAEVATREAGELEPRLPRLRIVVRSPPPGLQVVRDGRALPAAALGEALPVDPGRHEVNVSAPGHRAEQRSVVLEEGKTATVELSLAVAGAADLPAPDGQPSSGGVPAWVWVTGGAGVVLAGASVYFLAEDLAAIDALERNCRTVGADTYCAPGYTPDDDNTRKNRSLGLFLGLGGAGVIALGAAVAGLVLAPSAGQPGPPSVGLAAAPWGAPGGAGLMISGSFR